MTKTNKSLRKRIKITKTGKVLSRKAGHGHFNAKAKRTNQLKKKQSTRLVGYTKKEFKRLIPNY
ncbi:hypothetical protein A2645_01245 [Candidatus Nomurabacteria bacterium RIFCSPHIGHO2_01_FULL_39_9]|uniref:50S ribosomal protein L35 n=1 Tax=Candidatus Nomurabacteria bacterium RIFCSPHIGHO2_01_FULL_39_9 TaxID=1801735 RepID=A0A1F6UWH5_9BACT|nr:MAG: hypothetical protein A2645_01245 [Candidatus Nomurabacteria bacterium RIFCSPHIGHO2_01_FULL_39_9]